MSADDVDVPSQATPAEGMGVMLAFSGFCALVFLSLWEWLAGSPSRVLFVVAGFVLLVGMFAAVEAGP